MRKGYIVDVIAQIVRDNKGGQPVQTAEIIVERLTEEG